MKLIFDQNLSRQLPRLLADLYPGSRHVLEINLDTDGDPRIWAYAQAHDYVIVTKDNDYKKLSGALGHPPKVIRISSGNGPTSDVAALLRDRYADLLSFHRDTERGLLELP